MFKQSFKKCYLLALIVMISVFSFSAWSTPVAYAEKDGMVSDNFEQNNKEEQNKAEVNKADSSEDSTISSGMTAWEYLKILLALAFVVGLLFFVLKLVNRNNKKYQSNQMLQNLGGVSLGQQKSVQLLKVGNSLFLVGVGEDVQMIKEITDPTEQETLIKMHEEKHNLSVQTPYIAEMFQTVKDKFSKQPVEPTTSDFKEALDEKLNKIKKNRQQQLDDWSQKEKKDDE